MSRSRTDVPRLAAVLVGACVWTSFGSACGTTSSQTSPPAATSDALVYDAQTRGPVPIPPAERDLETVVATPWFAVSDQDHVLEGAIFDPSGNMFFCDNSARRVMRLTPDGKLTEVVGLQTLSPGGLAFRRDGRLFIAAMDIPGGVGAVMSVNADGSDLQAVIPPKAGYLPNDIAFSSEGGFYFTDFHGNSTDPRGGVYYASPDSSTITPVLPHLAQANGVTLSPDGRYLWATEFSRNLLHRIELADAVTTTPLGSAIPYQFTGPAPDSMRADADGNVYVAMYGQGRVLVLNQNGIPIGQILLPGREEGHNLQSTSMAIKPDTNDLYIVTNDGTGGRGAEIFHAKAFAKAIPAV